MLQACLSRRQRLTNRPKTLAKKCWHSRKRFCVPRRLTSLPHFLHSINPSHTPPLQIPSTPLTIQTPFFSQYFRQQKPYPSPQLTNKYFSPPLPGLFDAQKKLFPVKQFINPSNPPLQIPSNPPLVIQTPSFSRYSRQQNPIPSPQHT